MSVAVPVFVTVMAMGLPGAPDAGLRATSTPPDKTVNVPPAVLEMAESVVDVAVTWNGTGPGAVPGGTVSVSVTSRKLPAPGGT